MIRLTLGASALCLSLWVALTSACSSTPYQRATKIVDPKTAALQADIANTFKTQAILLQELPTDDELASGTAHLFYEGMELAEVLTVVLKGTDVRVVWHDDVDPHQSISGKFGEVPLVSLDLVCAEAGVGWHLGPSLVYIDAGRNGESRDKPVTIQYRLPETIVWHDAYTVEFKPNILSLAFRLQGDNCLARNSKLEISTVDQRTLVVSGFASDHVFFLDRVPYASPVAG